ncbi:MAG TPA: hypothetical protein RMH85_32530 [Polyangiaceae bacterium LLY-WYZ-15_(1-7)]|nr:hypothetical protein [Myxococcales bacterium]MAT25705.1 hypothetical protein [Sandaracinus sp.]HJL02174.1 hypothetical protein [Polyangiaceae bacterium LLY-WYZ-15_(1-7)]MBJ69817.1 hypothetical protein [Sandaracinus sp.]HJL13254.1 hypothetical protein [Polyangiaceae bacterium LLY-WYZ-15_(1-7)]
MIRPLLLAPALAALACGGVQVERYAEGEPVPTDMDLGFSEPAAPEHPDPNARFENEIASGDGRRTHRDLEIADENVAGAEVDLRVRSVPMPGRQVLVDRGGDVQRALFLTFTPGGQEDQDDR